jgi:hypothetical protein
MAVISCALELFWLSYRGLNGESDSGCVAGSGRVAGVAVDAPGQGRANGAGFIAYGAVLAELLRVLKELLSFSIYKKKIVILYIFIFL